MCHVQNHTADKRWGWDLTSGLLLPSQAAPGSRLAPAPIHAFALFTLDFCHFRPGARMMENRKQLHLAGGTGVPGEEVQAPKDPSPARTQALEAEHREATQHRGGQEEHGQSPTPGGGLPFPGLLAVHLQRDATVLMDPAPLDMATRAQGLTQTCLLSRGRALAARIRTSKRE